jgi:hypothetical protein
VEGVVCAALDIALVRAWYTSAADVDTSIVAVDVLPEVSDWYVITILPDNEVLCPVTILDTSTYAGPTEVFLVGLSDWDDGTIAVWLHGFAIK